MVKKGHCEGTVGKMAVKLSLLKRDETSWVVAALLTMLAGKNRLQWKRHIQLTSVVFFLSSEANVISSTTLCGEIAIQDKEKLIYRWETKRFALLTSCWLPVELHLVVVVFVVACHQMALWWWIHFQGNYMEYFDSNIGLTLENSSVQSTAHLSWAETHLCFAESIANEIKLQLYIHVTFFGPALKIDEQWSRYN